MKNQIKILFGAVALAMTGQVSAATEWVVASDYGTLTTTGIAVSAVSNTGGINNAANAANTAALQTIQTATWTSSYGGIFNADKCSSGSYCDLNETIQPEHAIDNNQRYDMVLLKFTAGAVTLTDLKLRYASLDSDITVMAYQGTGDPTIPANNKLFNITYSGLVGAGWEKIGNYSNAYTLGGAQNQSIGINANRSSSSYWLIGAYNPLANPDGFRNSTGLPDSTFDNVKLASVTSCGSTDPGCRPPGNVPEPGSLALFGLGLLGVFGLRKRQKG